MPIHFLVFLVSDTIPKVRKSRVLYIPSIMFNGIFWQLCQDFWKVMRR